MVRRPDGFVRAFGMSGMQILTDLQAIEKEFDLDFGLAPKAQNSRKLQYYAQFEADLRKEAAQMSELYEVFYCLENSIRRLTTNILSDAEGAEWWSTDRIHNDRVRRPCAERRQKEIDSGVTARSNSLLEYTTFGELSQIITDNWDLFDTIFTSKKAVSNITNQLNLMRGPIAHCNPTDELEHDQLEIIVKSWFKVMA